MLPSVVEDEHAGYFEGRDEDTRQVVDWLNTAEQGMYVITGEPGVGKSAFLDRIVVFADPVLVDGRQRAGLLAERPTDDLMPASNFDAVIDLSAKSLRWTVGRLAEVVAKLTETELGGNSADLLDALESHGEQVTVLVDGLDEALEPFLIAASLLRRLAAVPGVRVVVGTRRSKNERPDQKIDRTDVGLISALGFLHDSAEDRFSTSAGAVRSLADEPAAVERYVHRRLTSRKASPYDDQRSSEIAQRIRMADQPFLFARLATTELLAREEMNDDEIDQLLAGGHQGIFAAALQRFDEFDQHIVPLLRSLAYALGRGFPQREGIWRSVTEAIHPGLRIRKRNIEMALGSAGAYIVHDGELGDLTYRLAHETFTEHFLAEP